MMLNSARNNIAALESKLYLNRHSRDLTDTYGNISSGLAINHPKEDSAKFVNSEILRTKISDVTQAEKNTENAISMIQSAEAGLAEINELLVNMRRVAVHSANTAANDTTSLAVNQVEIDDSIQELDLIFANTSFGKRPLYKQLSGTNGYTDTDELDFVFASEKTQSSGVDGYAVNVTQLPTAASITALRSLNGEEIELGGVEFDIITGTENLKYITYPNETPTALVNNLNGLFAENNAALRASINAKNIITIRHTELGSQPSFQLAVNKAKLFSAKEGEIVNSNLGLNIAGTIDGEIFNGQGAVIHGKTGGATEGIKLRYHSPLAIDTNSVFDAKGNLISTIEQLEDETLPKELGRVFVTNNSLTFHTGDEAWQLIKFHLPEINSKTLANYITNSSGFNSLHDLDVTTFNGAQNSILLIAGAIDEITSLRAKLGSFQKNLLERSQLELGSKKEELIAAESQIRDADIALETINLTKQQLAQGAAVEALRNSNLRKQDLLRLFRS